MKAVGLPLWKVNQPLYAGKDEGYSLIDELQIVGGGVLLRLGVKTLNST